MPVIRLNEDEKEMLLDLLYAEIHDSEEELKENKNNRNLINYYNYKLKILNKILEKLK